MATASSSTAATKITYGASVGGFLGFLAQVDIIAWCGLGIALLTAVINWNYKRLENKRAQEIHDLKKKELEGRCNVKD